MTLLKHVLRGSGTLVAAAGALEVAAPSFAGFCVLLAGPLRSERDVAGVEAALL